MVEHQAVPAQSMNKVRDTKKERERERERGQIQKQIHGLQKFHYYKQTNTFQRTANKKNQQTQRSFQCETSLLHTSNKHNQMTQQSDLPKQIVQQSDRSRSTRTSNRSRLGKGSFPEQDRQKAKTRYPKRVQICKSQLQASASTANLVLVFWSEQVHAWEN